MDLSLAALFAQMASYPTLAVILVLVIGVTLIAGATDAPNAIATAVSTRCMKPTTALALAAIFNFVGLMGMTYVSTAVAHTMFNMVDFSGDPHLALMALMAAMIASIGWGLFCWFLGITAFLTIFSSKFNSRVLRIINIICGCVIIFYGLKLLYQFIQMIV